MPMVNGKKYPYTEAGMKAAKEAASGKAMKMSTGGSMPMVKKDGKMVPAFAADGKGKMAYGGKVKKMAYGGSPTKKKKKVKSGSSASRRADGCAVKGKTKGRMV